MTSTKKILVVDDEPDIIKWLTVLLEDNGYQVIAAGDGNEGFTKAETELPDLITLDITMPGESGVKMYRRLNESEKTSKIPVIILTGISSDFKKFISTRKQVPPPDAYFEKPVDEKELLNKVKELTS